MDLESPWRLTLDPDGGTPLVILDYGQRIGGPLKTPWKQATEENRTLRGEGMQSFGRKNVSVPLTLTVCNQHASMTALLNWQVGLMVALMAYSGRAMTARLEIQGGATYTLTSVVLEECDPTVDTAGTARSRTTWKLKSGRWYLGNAGPGDPGPGPDPDPDPDPDPVPDTWRIGNMAEPIGELIEMIEDYAPPADPPAVGEIGHEDNDAVISTLATQISAS